MAVTAGDNTPWTSDKIWSAVITAIVPLSISMVFAVIFRPGSWYSCLKKPCFTPPGWVFGVAWTILYPLLGVALIAACFNTDKPWSCALPLVNISVSLLFSIVMFGLHSTFWGMLVTLACFGMGIGLIVQYAVVNHSSLAWGLTIPYVAWTAFASLLAVWIYLVNSPCVEKLCRPKPIKRSCNWMMQ